MKYFNGVQLYGLLPGEELEELVFQEATWKPWLYFFRRPVTPDTLLMLTTNYMVVIQEDLKVRVGWIVSYLPRSGICMIHSQGDGLWTEFIRPIETTGPGRKLQMAPGKESCGGVAFTGGLHTAASGSVSQINENRCGMGKCPVVK